MSAEPSAALSRVEWFRQALAHDPVKLERFDQSIAEADSTPGVPDDLDDIARLLTQAD